jgi:hypothetical protein
MEDEKEQRATVSKSLTSPAAATAMQTRTEDSSLIVRMQARANRAMASMGSLLPHSPQNNTNEPGFFYLARILP